MATHVSASSVGRTNTHASQKLLDGLTPRAYNVAYMTRWRENEQFQSYIPPLLQRATRSASNDSLQDRQASQREKDQTLAVTTSSCRGRIKDYPDQLRCLASDRTRGNTCEENKD